MRKLAPLLVGALCAWAGGCSGDGPAAAKREPQEDVPARAASAREGSAPETSPPETSPPAPDAAIPRSPARLARRLAEVQRELGAAIDRWRADPGIGEHSPRDVTLWALHQQRIHLLLTARPALARSVIPRLPARAAAYARATIRARRGLAEITPPTPGRYRTGPPEPPRRLLSHYREAQRRFGVPWPVLGAVNFVESAFGRMRNSSAAGAQGPMQFIPSTWRAYGMGGDVNDPRDAVLGAANYLRASGAPGDLAGALYAYNPSELYVRAVLAYTDRIRRDRHAFLSYYSWQVFVREPDGGTRRITGPGR